MIGDKAAIAVLGPTRDDTGASAGLAERIGAELARRNYAVVVAGDGTSAAATATGAALRQGVVRAVVWDGADGASTADSPADTERDALRGLARVLELADAVMLLAGGLTETATLLQLLVHGLSPQGAYRQVVLVGPGWNDRMAALTQLLALDPRAEALVTYANDARDAVEALRYYVRRASESDPS